MQLTIIPVDGTVIEDGLSYTSLDLTSCGIPADIRALQWQDTSGWLEFWNQENQTITELPSWTNCCMGKWEEANNPPVLPPTADQNKQKAVRLLQQTDWTTIPDVSDPAKSNPYLSNANEFVTYRNTVRQYAINPIAGDINWPIMPLEMWTTV